MNRRSLVALLFAAISFIAGCNNSGTPQNSSNMRSFNAVADAEPLDVLVDEDVKNAAVALGSVSSYSNFAANTRVVKVRGTSNGAILSTSSLTFGSSASYTMVLHGRRAALGVLQLIDDTTTPASGKFKMRMLGVAPDAPVLDVYVGSADITTLTASIAGLAYTTVSDYIEFSSGANTITFTTTGTKDIVFQSTQTFSDAEKVTLAVFPSLGGGRLVNAALLKGSDATVLNNTLARMKAISALPDAATVNFKVDGATLLSNVPFTGASSYVTANAGVRNVQLELSSAPGTNIATLATTFNPARDYTVLAVGTLNAPALVAINDDNSVPGVGNVRVRFINARPDNTLVSVQVNFANQAGNIAPRTASPYFQLTGGASYTVTFVNAADGAVLATVDTGILELGGVYSVNLYGSGSTAQAKVVRDR
jgi:hypothetical protein